ncbi:helix-turn-helix transcriptional regulator [Bradyrhizobium iriomotense]|uniref:helix-turn-helix transcriptional regulator n=1 Tax=Bradyrhizobium iriomotense TaxID=441950 RepID=UPI001B8A726A|nr:AraC family transcriptional regulator [Bradyrhizobium iriomotense]MBR1130919.1 helix-turn-helix transcriptional regulator [Bradyrhizobium iriomotense]
MYTDLNSRDESFERFLSTFNLLVPHGKIELSGSRSAFRWHGTFAATSGFSWWDVESEIDWVCRLSHQKERLGLVLPGEGAVRARIRDRSLVIDRDHALALSVPEVNELSYFGHGSHGHVTLEFDVPTVHKTLSDIFEGASLRAVDLSPQLGLASPAGQTLKALVKAVGAGMRDASIRSEKSMALLGESILRLIFLNLPHGSNNQLRRHQRDATPRQIRDALDFMRANMHQPLTLRDVAAAAGISVRSLQYGFCRFRNVTPLAYLREIRLQAVQAELSSPLNALSIREVALKWGFAHMGHFAARYRATYGEAPSETARSARAETSRSSRR